MSRLNVPYWVKVMAVLKHDGRRLTDIVRSGDIETYSQAQRTVSILSELGILKRRLKGRNVFIHVSPHFRALVEASGVIVATTKKDIQKAQGKGVREKLSE